MFDNKRELCQNSNIKLINIAIGNLLKVTDIVRKKFLVKNLDKGLFIKALIGYKEPVKYFV